MTSDHALGDFLTENSAGQLVPIRVRCFTDIAPWGVEYFIVWCFRHCEWEPDENYTALTK